MKPRTMLALTKQPKYKNRPIIKRDKPVNKPENAFFLGSFEASELKKMCKKAKKHATKEKTDIDRGYSGKHTRYMINFDFVGYGLFIKNQGENLSGLKAWGDGEHTIEGVNVDLNSLVGSAKYPGWLDIETEKRFIGIYLETKTKEVLKRVLEPNGKYGTVSALRLKEEEVTRLVFVDGQARFCMEVS